MPKMELIALIVLYSLLEFLFYIERQRKIAIFKKKGVVSRERINKNAKNHAGIEVVL